MQDDLEQKTDAELDKIFAIEVAEWDDEQMANYDILALQWGTLWGSRDMHILITYLEKYQLVDIIKLPEKIWHVAINPGTPKGSECDHSDLTRAIVIALIRNKRLIK